MYEIKHVDSTASMKETVERQGQTPGDLELDHKKEDSSVSATPFGSERQLWKHIL